MPITPTVTGMPVGGDTANGTTYTTAAVTMTAGKLYLLWIWGTIGSGNPGVPSSVVHNAGTNPATFTAVTDTGTTSTRRSFLYRALPTATSDSGTITITFPAALTGAAWAMVEIDGIDTGGTNGADAVVQTNTASPGSGANPTLALSSARTSGNAIFGSLGTTAGRGDTTDVIQPGATHGYTELAENGYNTPASSLQVQWKETPTSDTVDWTVASAFHRIIIVEVKQAPGGGSTPITDSDSTGVSTSESEALAVAATETDSSAVSLSEAEALAVAVTQTDTATANTSETEAVNVAVSDTDTLGAATSEAEQASPSIADTDTLEIATSEGESLVMAQEVLDTDSVALELTEAESLEGDTADTDSLDLATTEDSNQTVAVVQSDSADLELTESESIASTATDTDSIDVALSESENVSGLADVSDTDTLGIATSETEEVLLLNEVSDTDTLDLSVSELETLFKELTDSDSLALALSETEIAEITAQDLVDTDTLAVALSELEDIDKVVAPWQPTPRRSTTNTARRSTTGTPRRETTETARRG